MSSGGSAQAETADGARSAIVEFQRVEPEHAASSSGPYAFGLSGFSEVLSSLAGGEGVIRIRGTDTPSAIGTTISFGCVRVDNDVIETMALMVPPGTSVEIQA